MLEVILLCSGGLGEKMLKHLQKKARIVCVLTDRASAGIVEHCAAAGIPCFAGNPRNPAAEECYSRFSCDLLLSVNYLFIVTESLLGISRRYCINFHGSLLPKYRGRTPHVWAIINGENETGVTAHLMDAHVDNGPIVKQVVVPIGHDDTGADILQQYASLYPTMIDDVLHDVESGTLSTTPQDATLATYFGKRTPEDGAISWHWHWQRIRNWVRAQARPYPGAFTFLNGERLIVHRADYSPHGFDSAIPDGTILASDETAGSLIVKTPNGALRISTLELSGSFPKQGQFSNLP